MDMLPARMMLLDYGKSEKPDGFQILSMRIVELQDPQTADSCSRDEARTESSVEYAYRRK